VVSLPRRIGVASSRRGGGRWGRRFGGWAGPDEGRRPDQARRRTRPPLAAGRGVLLPQEAALVGVEFGGGGRALDVFPRRAGEGSGEPQGGGVGAAGRGRIGGRVEGRLAPIIDVRDHHPPANSNQEPKAWRAGGPTSLFDNADGSPATLAGWSVCSAVRVPAPPESRCWCMESASRRRAAGRGVLLPQEAASSLCVGVTGAPGLAWCVVLWVGDRGGLRRCVLACTIRPPRRALNKRHRTAWKRRTLKNGLGALRCSEVVSR
jgi:hypothetical protein